jgi:Sec-independent protein translocase protein TatA
VLSLPDMAILGVLALLVFGEEKLPGIMRQAGRVMREVQNTSQSFIREMEHAADVNEPPKPLPEEPVGQDAEDEPVPDEPK